MHIFSSIAMMAKQSPLYLIVGLVLLFPSSLLAAEIEEHLLSGTKFIQAKKFKEAVREFETALSIEPTSPDANLLLGLTLSNMGDLEQALPYTKKASELKPTYASFYNLGLLYANLEENVLAIAAYSEAVKLNPRSYEAWHQLGKTYSAHLEFEKAVEAYQKAASLNPKFPDAYQGMGSAYYWSGNLSAALQQVDALTKLNFMSHARQLENWIKDKESKRKNQKK